MVWVYIIQSQKDKGYYTGITKNIESRLDYHNSGKVESTKRRKPFVLVHKEQYKNYKEARIREKEFKSYKGGNKFKELVN